MLRIACLADMKSYVVIICASPCVDQKWKSEIEVDQKWKWVKLKSIQIWLKITSIVPRKSYLLIIYANSYDNMHDSGDTTH